MQKEAFLQYSRDRDL